MNFDLDAGSAAKETVIKDTDVGSNPVRDVIIPIQERLQLNV